MHDDKDQVVDLTSPPDSLLKSLRSQIEFYLGNNNLVRDNYLVRKLWCQGKHKPMHCVALTDFLQFNKVKMIFARY